MNQKTLTKIEKSIIDDVIVRDYTTFDVAVFNHAVSYSLPTWRGEQLLNNQQNKSLAYIDYVKSLIRNNKI